MRAPERKIGGLEKVGSVGPLGEKIFSFDFTRESSVRLGGETEKEGQGTAEETGSKSESRQGKESF